MTNLAIVGVGYTEAFQVLRDANQYAALHHTRLAEGLAGSAGMAGDSSFASGWAASYDDAAGLAVAAFEDVVTALGATARLCAGSLDNHARAELASAALDPGEWPSLLVDHPYEVSAFVPPSSLGGDPSSLPGWANAILDHVEGFVWPDADLEALHAVAAVWRGLADHLDSAAELVARAASHLWDERSPEVQLAVDALGRLRSAIGDLAGEAVWLARSCSEYAEAVQAQRDAILDLVHDLLRDAVIIQAAGFLVGLVTAGTANAAAGGLNVAKIAAEGPRFLAMLDHLRDLAYTASLGLNAGATTITGIQTRLGPFASAVATKGTYVDGGAVLRAREFVANPKAFDPEYLRAMSPRQVRSLIPDWQITSSRSGGGVVLADPLHRARQIRIMPGYRNNRADPITNGPYLVLSQNGAKFKVPLEGNPTL